MLRMRHTNAIVKVVVVVILLEDLRAILTSCRVVIRPKVVVYVCLI